MPVQPSWPYAITGVLMNAFSPWAMLLTIIWTHDKVIFSLLSVCFAFLTLSDRWCPRLEYY
jgi:hypothetical protein